MYNIYVAKVIIQNHCLTSNFDICIRRVLVENERTLQKKELFCTSNRDINYYIWRLWIKWKESMQ